MNFLSPKLFLVVLLLAGVLRLWGAFDIHGYLEDEPVHVPAAVSLVETGVSTDHHWFLPPLSSIVMYQSLSWFGDTPFGRRITNVIFGICSVLMIYLVASRLFPQEPVSILAAGLLAMDPFHIYYSRTTFIEIPVSFFFLLFTYLVLEYTEKERQVLPMAGVALGLTIATKAYYVFAIPLVICYALFRKNQQRLLNLQLLLHLAITLLLLPLSIYLLTYFHWFDRGYSFVEFLQMKMDAVWHLQHLSIEQFHNRASLEAGGKPWEWFLKPFLVGEQLFSDGESGRFLVKINNPPFRFLTIPSLLLVSFYAWRKGCLRAWLIPLLFTACYALFLIVERPMFSYSAIAILPFAYLAISKAAVLVAQWTRREKPVYGVFFGAVLTWGLVTFPLVSGMTVPLSAYAPILSITKIIGTN